MGVILVENPPRPHRCRLPGSFWRWRHRVQVGAVVRCDECGARWQWEVLFVRDGWHGAWGPYSEETPDA